MKASSRLVPGEDFSSVRGFENIVVWAGAGLSVESGLAPDQSPRPPHFHDYLQEPSSWREAYGVWRQQIAQALPHIGHRRLCDWQPPVRIVTLNQDGLLQRAGCDQVVELHGSVWRERCSHCQQVYDWSPQLDERCQGCAGLLRPDVLFGGEELPSAKVEQVKEWLTRCDCLICVGTSGETLPAAEFPALAREAGAFLVEINPAPTRLSSLFDRCLRVPASQGLSQLFAGA